MHNTGDAFNDVIQRAKANRGACYENRGCISNFGSEKMMRIQFSVGCICERIALHYFYLNDKYMDYPQRFTALMQWSISMAGTISTHRTWLSRLCLPPQNCCDLQFWYNKTSGMNCHPASAAVHNSSILLLQEDREHQEGSGSSMRSATNMRNE